MYESPIKLNDLEWELNPIDHVIKDAAKSVGEQFDRYVLSAIAKTGITVDRDELVKALRYDRGQYREGYEDGVENGIGFATPKWIPVTEHLPEENGRYLTVMHRTVDQQYCNYLFDDDTEVRITRYYQGEWKVPQYSQGWINEAITDTVTHWMPLPEPPKEETCTKN